MPWSDFSSICFTVRLKTGSQCSGEGLGHDAKGTGLVPHVQGLQSTHSQDA